MKRSPLLVLLAVLAIGSMLLSQYAVSAQEAKKDHKKSETDAAPAAMGQDWSKMRDGLNDVFSQLQKEAGIKASRVCDDDTFMRRVYLDLVGRPPLPEEIEEFNPGKKDSEGRKGNEKREALIDKLLATPEHAEHFADWWTVTLIGRDADGNSKRYLRQYLKESFAENKPWSEMVFDMVGGQGRTPDNPEIGYLMSFENRKTDMAGVTSKVFLGKQIQCAQCHDHPYEDWTTDDFEGMEAFFKLFNTGAKGDGADRYWYTRDQVVHNKHEASAKVRLKGKYMFPTYLGRQTWEFEDGDNLRVSLAKWMTSKDNGWFRNMTVNRYMAYFLGMGFVTPVDDFNSINTPTFPVVLEMMGKDFAASGYDTNYLIRAICTSELYQREVDTNRTNRDDFKYYSHSFVKRLTPEQIQRSILHVVGVERLNKMEFVRDAETDKMTPDEKKVKDTNNQINGWKSNIGRLMRDAYGADPQMYEFGNFDGTIIQALMMMNADLMGPGNLKNCVRDIMDRYSKPADRITHIFMTVLGRRPSKVDIAILNGTVARWGGESEDAYTDLVVALMNTTEFITNH
ncbi:MAG: DUF1549 domain-containing protein [Planctomycetes bacterium]|nr:DUF1549 domain-containing protein [Planctomycetota bacterium]